jgi:hypothetical protein
MFDYAGENLTELFSGKADNQQGAAKEFFDKVKDYFDNSTVIIVLLNLESFFATDPKTASENKGTLVTAMDAFLKQAKSRSEKLHIAFVFTAFDQYKVTIEGRYGSSEEFLRREIPPLYNEFIDTNSPVKVLTVSAVADTKTFTDPVTGKTEIYPKSGFHSENIDEFLIPWLSQAVLGAQTQIDTKNEEERQDVENRIYITILDSQWQSIVGSTELPPVERFIDSANRGLPYPNRPNASELNTRCNTILNYAIDLHNNIKAREWENLKILGVNFLKSAVFIVAVIFVVWIGATVYKAHETARIEKIRIEKEKADVEKEKIRLEKEKAEALARVAEEERLRIPRPEVVKSEFEWACNRGLFDCWEHRATISVLIANKGGGGNVVTTVTYKGKTNSKTVYFNPDESKWVPVTVYDLPNHNGGDTYSHDAKAAGQ